eukprot:CAMPEP_0184209872 /NCGR_PEP_ID=MMETSP0976-20121227/12326_1 /TAXON_ID=483370 /ORGANISM="non described non described, Strain CCMP2097" /LENGTH=141 /DNA_ID=CAMNT_0026514535 /DNA_START=77 /DNA_END=499 /DNA_ORIENTATION=+
MAESDSRGSTVALDYGALAAALRRRDASEALAFGDLVVATRRGSRDKAAADSRAKRMEHELRILRHEAADVLGRTEAAEEAARLEIRVAALQDELRGAHSAEQRATAARFSVASELDAALTALAQRECALDGARAAAAAAA